MVSQLVSHPPKRSGSKALTTEAIPTYSKSTLFSPQNHTVMSAPCSSSPLWGFVVTAEILTFSFFIYLMRVGSLIVIKFGREVKYTCLLVRLSLSVSHYGMGKISGQLRFCLSHVPSVSPLSAFMVNGFTLTVADMANTAFTDYKITDANAAARMVISNITTTADAAISTSFAATQSRTAITSRFIYLKTYFT